MAADPTDPTGGLNPAAMQNGGGAPIQVPGSAGSPVLQQLMQRGNIPVSSPGAGNVADAHQNVTIALEAIQKAMASTPKADTKTLTALNNAMRQLLRLGPSTGSGGGGDAQSFVNALTRLQQQAAQRVMMGRQMQGAGGAGPQMAQAQTPNPMGAFPGA